MSTYVPFLMDIVGISNAKKAEITFASDHPYSLGEIVSFRVSKPYGMVEMNNQQATVVEMDSTSITVDIDSLNYTPFIYPPVLEVVYPAIVVPVGSGIIPNEVPPTINLQDAFDNVPD